MASAAENIASAVAIASPTVLQWYATITQKPVQPGYPDSLMRRAVGSDLGDQGPVSALSSTAGLVLVVAVVGVVVVLLSRR